MHTALPSRTALAVALRRATHQLCDHPPVFTDPLALPILPPDAAAALAAPDPRRFDTYNLAFRAFLAVRSRFAEDTLAAAVAAPDHPVRQYILLGAGLDTFPYRNPFPALHTFEVDHPATQSWKRGLLAAANIPIPPTHTFAPCNFESDRLPDALLAAGFDPAQPAFISWLGVVPYLTPDAFTSTLTFLGSLPHAALVFDYAVPPETLPFFERQIFKQLAKRVAAAGEPFQLFFTPDSLAAQAHAANFPHCISLSAADLNPRYFANRPDPLRLHGTASRIAHLRK